MPSARTLRSILAAMIASLPCGCEGPLVTSDAGTIDATAHDAGGDDASTREDARAPDAFVPPDSPRTDLVDVSHAREMRAVWLSSVSNLDFPSRTGLSESQARAELEAIVDRVSRSGLNAIFFQVRPESDALYASSLEPWSRFLTGTQGDDPGYDPLELLLSLAHERGIEVHAWLNPYRGMSSASATTAPTHVTRTLSSHAIRYGTAIVMDPGAAEVRAHVVSVIEDLADRHDVDGIHFDDYFYPYPDADGTPFPDDATYAAYTAGGGTLSLADWRRDNVNALVREVHDTLAAAHPEMRFGISPFGIYRPGMPAGIRGLDAYATIYCDAPHWLAEDWLDYLAPQLYWPTTPAAQAFEPLVGWWGMHADAHEHVFAGQALYRLGSTATWTLAELETQIEIVRGLEPDGRVMGSVFFRYTSLDDDVLGVASAFEDHVYASPALPPAIPRLTIAAPEPPTATSSGGSIHLAHPAPSSVRFFAVYREQAGAFVLDRVLGASATDLAVSPGTWAISSIGRGDVESRGARIVVE
ncbi:MAG: family 10 glycosylhydrolase [Sandaracinaceae bacterium]|nr:family 10 glycosylhydrolase [Sandaracinaceae bacterium]